MLDGVKIKLGGEDYLLPPLNLKLLRKFQAEVECLTDPAKVKELGFTEYSLKALPLLVANLQRNYPELTAEEVEERLPVAAIPTLINKMMTTSGFEETPNLPLAKDKNVSPSTGTS